LAYVGDDEAEEEESQQQTQTQTQTSGKNQLNSKKIKYDDIELNEMDNHESEQQSLTQKNYRGMCLIV